MRAKKMATGLLALAMVMGMGTTALAAPDPADMTTITITKDYEAANPGTTSPAETFQFTIERTSVSDAAEGVTKENMPIPTIGTVAYTEGEAGSATKSKEITVTLPEYTSVGIYTYTIRETAGTTAGVTYFGEDIKLVVTVLQGESGKLRVAAVHTEASGQAKADNFPNTYSAGTLAISKDVTGNLGDTTKYFKVTVTLTGEKGKVYAENYAVAGGSYETNPKNIAVGTPTEFWLKDGETISISNLPYGVTYTVEEADYTGDGYDAAAYDFSDANKKIDTANDTVTVINNKDTEIDTGVFLDNLPYITLLVLAAGGMSLFIVRKNRRAKED